MGKWFTRARPMIDRVACPWLIEKFIDQKAEFIYVPRDPDGSWTTVVKRAKAEGGKSFDAPGADFFDRPVPNKPGYHSSTFEMMVEHYKLDGDAAMMRLAKIIAAADDRKIHYTEPRAAGLVAIQSGAREFEPDDQKLRQKLYFVYDSLYTWCQVFPEGNYFKDPSPYV